jgi:two-component system heavy metal sensor histidine kinase CusS
VAVDIIVAQEVDGLDHDIAMIGWLLFLVTSSTILVSEWLMAWAVRRSLRPLNRLADSIAKLDDDDFGKRIKIQDTPTELAPVIDHLNDLLSSIDSILTRERGFSADVSHELRTPLSGLLSTIDVCLRKPRDPENYQHALTTCRRITRQMQGVVVNLLDLTRLESKRTVVPCEPVDLHRLIGTQWCLYTECATRRHVTVKWRLNHGLALTNADRLGQIIGNLFDNAVSYVNEGGMITVTSCERDGKQEIIIANTGSQISADQVAQVFERFWRADRARADSHQHCGLGLTLCRRLITVLGGTITVQSQTGGIFEVHLLVPAADLDGEETINEKTPAGNVATPEGKLTNHSIGDMPMAPYRQ